MLAHSRKIIGGHGGFARLGRYWLGRDGPKMEVAMSKEDVHKQMQNIRVESDCVLPNTLNMEAYAFNNV